MRRFLARAIVVVAVVTCSGSPGVSRYEHRFDDLSRFHHASNPWPERGRAVVFGMIYDAVWAPEYEPANLASRDDRELDLLFRAAHLAATYTLDERHVRHMRGALDVLDRRGSAASRHHVNMYKTYVHARMLGDARTLARHRPMAELEVLPEIRDTDLAPGLPSVWVVDPDRRALARRDVELAKGVQVVVISHPGCHFSRAAMLAIESDPILASIFETHATWLAPQDSSLAFDRIQRWNRDHPAQPIVLTIDRRAWSMIDQWNTPTFYVLREGVVTARVNGWPRAGRRAELVRALEGVGLL
jgi:hypothetical protein